MLNCPVAGFSGFVSQEIQMSEMRKSRTQDFGFGAFEEMSFLQQGCPGCDGKMSAVRPDYFIPRNLSTRKTDEIEVIWVPDPEQAF